jgi:S-adenosylmethionine hydrolase
MKPLHPGPLVTLTTDFGLADHYVGTMKGVLLSRCPGVRIADISHEIAPFSIHSGAYTIDQAAPYFPPGTIHVIVVDPGVGTARKAVLVEALGQIFIAPDNGVLSMIISRDRNAKAREITNPDLWLSSPSSTFHGRDIFAPVAAALASGATQVENVGPIIPQIELLPDLHPRQEKPGQWQGKLLSIDRFGNAITNFTATAFSSIASCRFSFRVGRHRIARFHATFGEAPSGLCFAYFGSSGYIELGVKQQSAAALLEAAPGDLITLRFLDLHKA